MRSSTALNEPVVLKQQIPASGATTTASPPTTTWRIIRGTRSRTRTAAKCTCTWRIAFHADSPSHVRYADICLHELISEVAAERASCTHGLNFLIVLHKHNGEDMTLVTVEGDSANRLAACDALEALIAN